MASSPTALGPFAALRAAWAMMRARPGATLALGAALSVSLLAVCCGFGALAVPWFSSELAAMQIADARGRAVERSRAWVWAGAVQLLSATVLGSVGLLSVVAVGANVLEGGGSGGWQVGPALGLLAVGGGLSIALNVHFQYAAAILIDRGGDLHSALLESARIVQLSGSTRSWLTSVTGHALQGVPIVAGAAWTVSRDAPLSLPLWALAVVPLLIVVLPLGQCMVIASYLHLRGELIDPGDVPDHARPSRAGATVSLMLLGALALGPAMVVGAMLRPSPLRVGRAQGGTAWLQADASEARVHHIRDTALALHLAPNGLRVVASDGGGAGQLPIPGQRPLRRLRVFRQGAVYTLEIERGSQTYVARIDQAGVRLDDTLSDRGREVLPVWGLALLLGSLLWAAVWMSRAVSIQARIRQRMAQHPSQQAATAAGQSRVSMRAAAVRVALWLAPASLASVWVGALAISG